jgi:hypothetical protein
MNKTTSGWVLFIVALGMMSGLMANDVGKLTDWSGARTPQFIAIIMAHFSAVTVAFVAGKMIPDVRTSKLTRHDDEVK